MLNSRLLPLPHAALLCSVFWGRAEGEGEKLETSVLSLLSPTVKPPPLVTSLLIDYSLFSQEISFNTGTQENSAAWPKWSCQYGEPEGWEGHHKECGQRGEPVTGWRGLKVKDVMDHHEKICQEWTPRRATGDVRLLDPHTGAFHLPGSSHSLPQVDFEWNETEDK